MTRFIQLAALVLLATASPQAHAQPKGVLNLSWTVQQREDGELSPVLHIMRLNCWGRSCSLQTVTINRCWDLPGEQRSTTIVVEDISTEDPVEPEYRLKVEFGRNALLLRYVWMGGSFTHRLRLGQNDIGSTVLVGYEGAMVKDSDILGRLLTVEFVPVKASQPAAGLAYRTLDCPLQVPAVRVVTQPAK